MKAWKNFTVTYKETQEKFKWAFRREGNYWILKDHDQYERVLEKTWIDSVPRIQAIADNYGMTCNIS
jgi:hypothetical protein